MTLFFDPPAQNTIIRPLAEAVCISHGGEPTFYVDTSDHKTKVIALEWLHFLTLQTQIDGAGKRIDGYKAALLARHNPLEIQVNINDIPVLISPKTTVTQAMNQYHRKYAKVNNIRICKGAFARQKD